MNNNLEYNQIEGKSAKTQAIVKGVILGIISFVLGVISIVFMSKATSMIMFSVISTALNFIVFIAISCVLTVMLRKDHGGFWEFSTALKNIFIMLAISAILSTIATSVMNTVSPSFQENALNNMINITIEGLEGMGAADEQIDNTVEQLEQQKEAIGKLSFGQVIKGLGISLILYFVFALILAAIFKKEPPVFVEQKTEGAHPWQGGNDSTF